MNLAALEFQVSKYPNKLKTDDEFLNPTTHPVYRQRSRRSAIQALKKLSALAYLPQIIQTIRYRMVASSMAISQSRTKMLCSNRHFMSPTKSGNESQDRTSLSRFYPPRASLFCAPRITRVNHLDPDFYLIQAFSLLSFDFPAAHINCSHHRWFDPSVQHVLSRSRDTALRFLVSLSSDAVLLTTRLKHSAISMYLGGSRPCKHISISHGIERVTCTILNRVAV